MNGLDSKEFSDELELMAQNDGDAYRAGKNAGQAVRQSFEDFQKRRRAEERVEFNLAYDKLVGDLTARWEEQ